jgi:2-polyprenyl-6-methoxyphenol hydroxylase-like FAD-dependent oxidoreductase
MSRKFQTSVLVVGAGPIGLSLALDLAWRGVDCILIDQGDGTMPHSKIGLISVRSMELFRRWGMVDRVRQCGFPDDYPLNMVFCTSLAGYTIGISEYPSSRDDLPTSVSPETKQRCPQLWLDPILAKCVGEYERARILYHCELLSFKQTADRVLAQTRDVRTGESLTIEAQYLVGTDGARSTVRRALGIRMEGDAALSHSMSIYIRSPGLLTHHDKGPAERYLMVAPDGLWGNLTVIDGDALWRLTVLGSATRPEAGEFDARAWVLRCFGTNTIPFEIDAVLPWRRSRLVAERFGRGCVFMAGDAVHTMSPTGGFGMNTGIADVADLGWKLDAVLRGWGGSDLLESYDAERRPAGWRNVNAAADNFQRLITEMDFSQVNDANASADQARRTLGAQLKEATQREWEVTGVALGYRYENSPICIADGTPPTPDDSITYIPTARPGHRAPHAYLPDGRSTLDLFGRGYVLLNFGADAGDVNAIDQTARSSHVPLAVVPIGDAKIAELYERKLVLVRPDGHVAWRADELERDSHELIDIVRGAGRLVNAPMPAASKEAQRAGTRQSR